MDISDTVIISAGVYFTRENLYCLFVHSPGIVFQYFFCKIRNFSKHETFREVLLFDPYRINDFSVKICCLCPDSSQQNKHGNKEWGDSFHE